LGIVGFALHIWVIPENPIEHVFFSHLKSVLVSDLLGRNEASIHTHCLSRVFESLDVLAQKFKELQLLPEQLLLPL